MPVVRIDRCLLVTLQMIWQGQIVENVVAFKYATTDARPSGAELAVVAQFVWTTVQSAYRSITTTQIRYVQVIVRDISPSNLVEGAYSVPGVVTGGLSIESMPNQVAAVVSWHTSSLGPNARGRTFVPGLSIGAITTGFINNSTLVLLQAIGAAWFNMSGTVNTHTTLVVASRLGQVWRIVTSYSVDNIFDTQRRRVIGRGH